MGAEIGACQITREPPIPNADDLAVEHAQESEGPDCGQDHEQAADGRNPEAMAQMVGKQAS